MASPNQIKKQPPLMNGHSFYCIKGFRSLANFQIELKPGVNILVGPNGSGKTNFIAFLDFIHDCMMRNVSAAISRSGGIAKVFSIEEFQKNVPCIKMSVSGTSDHIFTDTFEYEDAKIFDFDYSIEIKFNKTLTKIYIARELLTIRSLRRVGQQAGSNALVGRIELKRSHASPEEPPQITFGPRLMVPSERNPLNAIPLYESIKTPREQLTQIESSGLSADESIFSSRRRVPILQAVSSIIARSRSFNIIPSVAKEPDDITSPPTMDSSGAGLSATLYDLQRRSNLGKRPRRDRLSRAFETIVEWTRLVFPGLQNISVATDPHTGKFAVRVQLDDKGRLKIPLQALSDGTVKWLSIASAIISRRTSFSIEEPENFLHPKMQTIFLQIARDAALDLRGSNNAIISTHSETIINNSKPEELIIFAYDDGSTLCRRLSNPDAVISEINRTGFGLGYYYASNALS